MDQFQVPKKVNRHVIKAVIYLTNVEEYEFAPLEEVQAQVRYTMRNLLPVTDLDKTIETSLGNMIGMKILIEQDGGYALNTTQG